MTLALPFPGPLVIPPAIAFWIEFGTVHADRPRLEKDANGYDCNDHAFDAVQALIGEGRDPYYVDCQIETGEGHMIAAYKTDDGVVYARDCRVESGDVPLEELVAHGYKLISAADRKGELWHAAEAV